jgi:hypothetical protein
MGMLTALDTDGKMAVGVAVAGALGCACKLLGGGAPVKSSPSDDKRRFTDACVSPRSSDRFPATEDALPSAPTLGTGDIRARACAMRASAND